MSRIPVLGGSFWRPGYYAERWGLQAYWNLQDVSDAWINGQTLTNNNATTFTAGKIGNAATFVSSSSQSLSRASESLLQTGNIEFWLAFWVKAATPGSNQVIVSKTPSGSTSEYSVLLLSSGGVRFTIFSSGGGSTQVAGATGIGDNSYHFVVCYQEPLLNRIGISVDNGAFTFTIRTVVTGVNTNIFRVGAFSDSTNFLDGQVALTAFGKNPPGGIANVIAEINTTLFNSTTGRLWPF